MVGTYDYYHHDVVERVIDTLISVVDSLKQTKIVHCSFIVFYKLRSRNAQQSNSIALYLYCTVQNIFNLISNNIL